MADHWSVPYVGLPWRERGVSRDGLACWGIVHLVYREVLGLEVPDYSVGVLSVAERERIAEIFADATATGPWVNIRIQDAAAFDVLVFRRAGMDMHVGLHAAPGRMLHITAGERSSIVDYSGGAWKPRLSAVYRHKDLIA